MTSSANKSVCYARNASRLLDARSPVFDVRKIPKVLTLVLKFFDKFESSARAIACMKFKAIDDAANHTLNSSPLSSPVCDFRMLPRFFTLEFFDEVESSAASAMACTNDKQLIKPEYVP